MPKRTPINKEMIERAMRHTLSNRAAAKYLSVSYVYYKEYAKMFMGPDGRSLFDIHKNQKGIGIPKFIAARKKEPPILDIIEGRVSSLHFTPQKIKERMIKQGYVKEECYHCGFKERRVLDYKMPLIMHFKNNKKTDYHLENVQLLCYNCYFLFGNAVFEDKDLEQLETHRPLNETTDAINWELDDYHLARLKEIGLMDKHDTNDDDGSSLISRI
jgi:hypothetical protein